jgi:bifunctional UDP-N-acetylglucosamine pyrophosphorylase/glucosamine-1-phosphate N-acetyltransferase
MVSGTPKVLHALCGRTMLGHVLAAIQPLHADRTLVVVGHGREQVTATLPGTVTAVVQDRQGGTGHAVRTALEAAQVTDGTVLVVPGDAPLLTAATLTALLAGHEGAASLLTTHLSDPTGYGRVVRDAEGGVREIVEERDASPEQRALAEVAVSTYVFAAGHLRAALDTLSTANAAGEEYLTDVVKALGDKGLRVSAHATDPVEVMGVNDRAQLAAAMRALNARLVHRAMLAGVTVTDPQTTWLGVAVSYEPDAVIAPNTQLHGSTHLGGRSVVGPNTTLSDVRVGADAHVIASTATGTDIGAGATVGPYAHLRPGTVLGAGAKVGAFVETKSAEIGAGAKVPHLSYVGDATVGPRSNVGAGTIVVNYDGVAKHRTEIGADVRIGSNNSLVAPVTVGDGAYTGADAVIRHDVPPGALSYSENAQVIHEDWAPRHRPAPTLAPQRPSPAECTDQQQDEGTP